MRIVWIKNNQYSLRMKGPFLLLFPRWRKSGAALTIQAICCYTWSVVEGQTNRVVFKNSLSCLLSSSPLLVFRWWVKAFTNAFSGQKVARRWPPISFSFSAWGGNEWCFITNPSCCEGEDRTPMRNVQSSGLCADGLPNGKVGMGFGMGSMVVKKQAPLLKLNPIQILRPHPPALPS